jgi:class 3 adenylate cyclase/tetratricopeptide (TPR) repeat protein
MANMNVLEMITQVRSFLEQNGRVSYRMLRRQFELDDETLEDLKEELIDVQQVAADDGGKVLVWLGSPGVERSAEPAPPSPPQRDPASYTPAHLADRILTSRGALEGERKQVTVLFADVVHSMEISERLDPEIWRGILDQFFQILADRVHRFEGTINQYTGDGIMALFGAPIAHEDHPQRACYAALELRERLAEHAREVKRAHGIDFSTRIGLNSGEVVVGKIGDDLRMDYTAQGHSVGLAARMQELASPNTIYLADATAQLVSGYFNLQDLGTFPINGVTEPVLVHELQDVSTLQTRFDVSRSRGLTQFVGRDSDMDALEAALEQAGAGHGQVVGVVAEAGTGKSRLCYEFVERCRARGRRVLEGHCVAHGKNISLLPILQVFRDYFGIGPQDPERLVREKIAGRMLLFDESYRDVLPLLFELLCVPDADNPAPSISAEERQRSLFGVLRSLVQRPPVDGHGVALIEDLHWLDAASEAWVEEWVDAVAGSSSLLIVNFRPEYHAAWMQKSWYRQLPLAPLGAGAIRDLIGSLLGDDTSLEGVADAIHTRTGGNPFFAEETVRGLIEAGNLEGTRGAYRLVTPVEKLAIPATVHSLLSARIDRLVERDKLVLQAASVIGNEFAEPILEAVAELPRLDLSEALGVLKAAEFVYEESLYPIAEYAFKHPLTQEVALNSQLRDRRRRTHAAVAQALENASPDKLDARAALLAHHWDEAGDERQAATWHHRAAEAIGFHHLDEAMRHFRRVKHLVDRLPPSPEQRREAAMACSQILWFGIRAGIQRTEAQELFDEAMKLAEEVEDPGSAAYALLAYGTDTLYTGLGPEAYPLLRRAVEEADRTDDIGLRVATLWGLAIACHFEGDLDSGIAPADEGIALSAADTTLGEELLGYSPYYFLHAIRGGLHSLAGRVEDAERDFEIALQSSGVTGYLSSAFLVAHCELTGDARTAMAQARRAVAGLEESGSTLAGVVFMRRALGIAHALCGEWPEALEAFEYSREVAREAETFLQAEPETLCWVARSLMELGELGRAGERLDEALVVGERMQSTLHVPHCRLVRAKLLRVSGAPHDEIEGALGVAIEAARELARFYEPLVLLEYAEFAGECGDEALRRVKLEAARVMLAEMGAVARAAEVGGMLGG